MNNEKINLTKLGRCSNYFYKALQTLNSNTIKRILDLGCGDGRTFYLLDGFKDAKGVGLDLDLNGLKKAQKKCLAVLGGGERLPFLDNSFDLIVEFHVLHHIPDYSKAISEVYRCLRKGGYFLMVEAVNDNPIFRFIRDKHPITKHMPIESNFKFQELMNGLEKEGFAIRSKKRFGLLFEFTLGGIPGMPFFIRRFTSTIDEGLERIFGIEYCASCVVLAKKE